MVHCPISTCIVFCDGAKLYETSAYRNTGFRWRGFTEHHVRNLVFLTTPFCVKFQCVLVNSPILRFLHVYLSLHLYLRFKCQCGFETQKGELPRFHGHFWPSMQAGFVLYRIQGFNWAVFRNHLSLLVHRNFGIPIVDHDNLQETTQEKPLFHNQPTFISQICPHSFDSLTMLNPHINLHT